MDDAASSIFPSRSVSFKSHKISSTYAYVARIESCYLRFSTGMLPDKRYQKQMRTNYSTAYYAAPSHTHNAIETPFFLRFAPLTHRVRTESGQALPRNPLPSVSVSIQHLRGQRFFLFTHPGRTGNRLRPKNEEATSPPDNTPRARHFNEQTQLPRVSRRPSGFGQAHVQREGP